MQATIATRFEGGAGSRVATESAYRSLFATNSSVTDIRASH
jgi:hypothetical protein